MLMERKLSAMLKNNTALASASNRSTNQAINQCVPI